VLFRSRQVVNENISTKIWFVVMLATIKGAVALQPHLQDLKSTWVVCQDEDTKKAKLLSDLFQYIALLQDQLSTKESDLREKTDLVELYRSRLDKAQGQVHILEREKASNAFVTVLLDGDHMIFKPELVQKGFDGGTQAALLLKREVIDYLTVAAPSVPPDAKINVRLYANYKGLSKTIEGNKIASRALFGEFVRGFNMADTLCEYVDAGDGKDCADVKLEDMFKLHIGDVHCRHVIFGGPADRGYARLLVGYTGDEGLRDRITLLEGPPFARELIPLKDKFRTCKFETLFIDKNLAETGESVTAAPPEVITAQPKLGYALVASKSGSVQPDQLARAVPNIGKKHIPVNKNGQRVDTTLKYDQTDFTLVKSRRLCNQFQLLGTCSFKGSYGNCSYDHDFCLSETQKEALRAVSRLGRCISGSECRNADCIHGHHCNPRHCPGEMFCRFLSGLHNVDTVVVRYCAAK